VIVNLAFGAVLRGNSHRECGSRRIPAAAVRRFPDAAVRRSGISAIVPTAADRRQRRIFASLAARGCLYLNGRSTRPGRCVDISIFSSHRIGRRPRHGLHRPFVVRLGSQ
jgi:hypothetical protein